MSRRWVKSAIHRNVGQTPEVFSWDQSWLTITPLLHTTNYISIRSAPNIFVLFHSVTTVTIGPVYPYWDVNPIPFTALVLIHHSFNPPDWRIYLCSFLTLIFLVYAHLFGVEPLIPVGPQTPTVLINYLSRLQIMFDDNVGRESISRANTEHIHLS